MDGFIASLPNPHSLHPVPPPPSPQLVNNVAAVVNSIRQHIHASPDAASATVAFLSEHLVEHDAMSDGMAPLSPAVSMGSSAIGDGDAPQHGAPEGGTPEGGATVDTQMQLQWDTAHAATDDLYGAMLRQRPLEDSVTPRRQKIRELLQVVADHDADQEDEGASEQGSRGRFARSEAVLELVAEELTQVPQLYARANLRSLLLNLDDLVKSLEELRQRLIAFLTLLP